MKFNRRQILITLESILATGFLFPWLASADGPEVNIDGPGNSDISIPSGRGVHKNGEGRAIVRLRASCHIWMDGPGDMYVWGMNDYAGCTIDNKNGSGNLIFIPNEGHPDAELPAIRYRDGRGDVRLGSRAELAAARGH